MNAARLALPTGIALVAGALLPAFPAGAAVSVHTSLASFRAAAPGASLRATFEDRPLGRNGRFAEGGLSFSSPLKNLLVIGPSAPGTARPDPPSRMLSGKGHEDIVIVVRAGWTYSIGFTLLTNRHGPHTATLYDTEGRAFFQYSTKQDPNTVGFVGFVSTTPIRRMRWAADRGNLQDTGLDDIHFSPGDATPSSASLEDSTRFSYR